MKAAIGSRGVGVTATVNIKRRNGTKVRGYISEAQEESFTLVDAKTLQATTIGYDDVAKVDNAKTNKRLPEWATLLIIARATIGGWALEEWAKQPVIEAK